MHALSNKACPHCRSFKTSRSHKRGGDERYLLRVIGILPHRCLNCDARFYAFSRFGARTSVAGRAA
jgi:hypothetical protein